MSFKIHLIIISVIIALVYMVQLLFTTQPEPVQQAAQVTKVSEYSISVVRASWGLNCRIIPRPNEEPDPFAGPNSGAKKIRENNVLTPVSELCNGKPQCDILIDPTVLGGDPLPSCISKTLQVEYRCFSFDRIWKTSAPSGTLSINCEANKS